MEEIAKKFVLDVTIDYVGFPDYYSGHGHAFADKDLVACIRFGFPVTYRETAEQLEEDIYADIVQTWDVEILNEEYYDENLGKNIDSIEDEDIKKAIKEEVANINFSFYHSFADELRSDQEDDEDQMQEYPELIGYMHIYKSS
jgi:hypothetical protein